MDFACSRCAHRQSEDSSCGGCGNDVVQDLRDPRGRQVLRDAESRLHRQRLNRYVAVGAVFCVVLGVILYGLFYWIAGVDLGRPEYLVRGGAARAIGMIILTVLAALALGLIALLERTLGRRRKFPYLDDYGG
jgi:hypothetical protein